MKILFIGGTGLISSACSELAAVRGLDLTVLNRGASKKYPVPAGVKSLIGDVHGDINQVASILKSQHFDVVVDWIGFTTRDIQRDLDLFTGKTGQFVFISSASAYQKPVKHYLITENTPLENPFWQYSRDKIACENLLMNKYHDEKFPVTIVRPSLTYGPSQIPLAWSGWQHPYTVIDRMRRGAKVIIPGDGTSLWVSTWNGDFAKGFLGLLGRGEAIGEAFHITSDEVLNWDQMFTLTAQAAGVEPKIVHIASDMIATYQKDAVGSLIGDKSNSVVFDNSKIKRQVPDFICEVPWAEGVRRSIAWFDADADRRTTDIEMNLLWDKIIAGYEKAYPA